MRRRVAVTTDRFDEAADSYAEAGLEPVSLPCIRVEPSSSEVIIRARLRCAASDVIVITSPRVVSLLWPWGGMPDVEVMVVGTATAEAVTRAGGRVGLVGDGGLARLVELATDRLGEGRVVIVHAAGSDLAAMAQLRRVADSLDDFEVYRSVPVAPGTSIVDGVAFASPSAVAGWTLSRDLDGLAVGAIGATTARALAPHRDPDVIAAQPSHRALAQAIAEFMEVKV